MAIYHDDLDLRDGEELYMDEFGERIDNDPALEEDFDDSILNDQPATAESESDTSRSNEHEAGFRETLSETDQISNEELQREAEAEHPDESAARQEDA